MAGMSLGQRAGLVEDAYNPVKFAARSQRGRSPAERAQLRADMDKLQKVVDVVGMADPTGIADLTNAIASLMRAVDEPESRGEHVKQAAISAIGAAPFIGQVTGAGRLAAKLARPAYRQGLRAAKRVPGGRRVFRASWKAASERPGVMLSLVYGVTKMIRIALSRTAQGPERVEEMGGAIGELQENVSDERGLQEGLQNVAGGSFDWYAQQQQHARQRAQAAPRRGLRNMSVTLSVDQLIAAGLGGAVVGGGWAYQGLRSSNPSFVARPSPGRSRSRNLAAQARRVAGTPPQVSYRQTNAAYRQAVMRSRQNKMRKDSAAGSPRQFAGRAARTGLGLGMHAAIASNPALAAGVYGAVLAQDVGQKMTAVIRRLSDQYARAAISLLAFTAAVRLSTGFLRSRQTHLLRYSGEMGAAAMQFNYDQMRRDMRMAHAVGPSYRRLSEARSRLEDAAQPYRNVGTWISNQMGAGMAHLGVLVFGVLNILSLGIVPLLNRLLEGGAGPILPDHHQMLIDIARGTAGRGPVTRPRRA